MHESKYSFLMKMVLRSLSEEKRRFHSFIEEIEMAYVDQAETAEQYYNLLTLEHPYRKAAAKFNLRVEEARQYMQTIDAEIQREVDKKMKSAFWLECTPSQFPNQHHNQNKNYLTFL
ncbi:MAG: hypothetical protein ACQEV7_09755 [Bacillota bacterium]